MSAQPAPVDFDAERAMRLLERIHELAAELRGLTGDALAIRVESVSLEAAQGAVIASHCAPASPRAREAATGTPRELSGETPAVGTDAPRSTTQLGALREQQAMGFLRDRHGRARQSEIAAELDCGSNRAKEVLERLERSGAVRRAGTFERAPGVTAGRPSPVWELVQSPPPQESPPLSPRTRKSVERAEREREAEPERREPEPVRSLVLDALARGPRAIPEIAKALGQPAVLVAQEIRMLQDRGLVEKQFSKFRRLDVGGSS